MSPATEEPNTTASSTMIDEIYEFSAPRFFDFIKDETDDDKIKAELWFDSATAYALPNDDGGWGLHIEGHSTMFSTALSYICMRILGEGPDDGGQDNACPRDRKWILDHDGVTHMPSWGKTWLSILGLFDWSGSNPMPPEFWILPSFLPMHPVV